MELMQRRRQLMAMQSEGLPKPIYDVRNVSLATKLDTGILLLQDGKPGWCMYFDQTSQIVGARQFSTSNVIAYYVTYWYWGRDGATAGCSGRMTSDNVSMGVTDLRNAIINANFETMELDVIINDGEILRPTKAIPNRLNSTSTVTFGPTSWQTLNRLIIWDHPLTETEIAKVFMVV